MNILITIIVLFVSGVANAHNVPQLRQTKLQMDKRHQIRQKEIYRRKHFFSFRNPQEFLQQLHKRERFISMPDRFFLEEFSFDTTKFWGTAPGEQSFPDIAFDGTNYFVVWMDDRGIWVNQIYGARLKPEGILLDTTGIPISVGDGNRLFPSVAFDGANYFVVWMDDRDNDWYFEIYGARINSQGNVLDTAGIPIATGSGDRMFSRNRL